MMPSTATMIALAVVTVCFLAGVMFGEIRARHDGYVQGKEALPVVEVEYENTGDMLITTIHYKGRVHGVFNGVDYWSLNSRFTIQQDFTGCDDEVKS